MPPNLQGYLRSYHSFYFTLTPDLLLENISAAFLKVAEDLKVGDPIGSWFRLTSPGLPWGSDELAMLVGQPISVTSTSNESVAFGGSFHALNEGAFLFLGYPQIPYLGQISEFGLSLADFAPHDPMNFYVGALQVKASALGDLKRFTDELERQHANLEKLVDERTRELNQSRDLIGALADNLPQFISFKDMEGRFQFVNKCFEEWVCINRESIVGKTLHDIYPEEQAVSFAAQDREAIDSQSIMSREVYRSYPDGKSRTVISTRFPVRASTGAVLGLGMVDYDVSERKEMECVLRESQQRLNSIMNSVVDGVITYDEEGVIQTFNRAAERIFGYSMIEVLNKNIRILTPEPNASDHDDYLLNVWNKDATTFAGIRPEITGQHKDGTTFPLEVSISQMDLSGQTMFAAICRDITERKAEEAEKARLETQLRQAQKMEAVGTLAGGIAHDLNNTLVPVLGLVELTLEEVPADSLARANLEMVVAAAERSKDLVSQILAFSRQDAPERIPVKLCQVIKETLSFLRASLPSTIEIRQKLDETLEPVLADATQIHQILLNLGSNAGDAMGLKGGVLEVVLERAEADEQLASYGAILRPVPHAKIVVSDTGPGMDENTCARIFDPFFTTKAVGEGTGMGLSVVHGIVESHDGVITVTSEEGRGTSFEIYLPVSKEKEVDEPSVIKDVNPALAV